MTNVTRQHVTLTRTAWTVQPCDDVCVPSAGKDVATLHFCRTACRTGKTEKMKALIDKLNRKQASKKPPAKKPAVAPKHAKFEADSQVGRCQPAIALGASDIYTLHVLSAGAASTHVRLRGSERASQLSHFHALLFSLALEPLSLSRALSLFLSPRLLARSLTHPLVTLVHAHGLSQCNHQRCNHQRCSHQR